MKSLFFRTLPLAIVAAVIAVAAHFAHAGPSAFQSYEFVTFASDGSPFGLNIQDGRGGSIYAHDAVPAGDRFEASGAEVNIPDLGIVDNNATVSWTLVGGAWSDIRILAAGNALVEQSRRIDGSTVAITFTHATSKAKGQLRQIYEAGAISAGALKSSYR